MPLGLDLAPWIATGATASALGVLTEDSSLANRHSIYQSIQTNLVDKGLGTDVIYKARVRPLNRSKCWIGARQNNNTWMVSFNLTGSGSVELIGSLTNISSASIVDNGDGSYTCRVNFSGTFSTTASVFGIGGLITAGVQTYDGNGLPSIEITEAQLIKGTSVVPYVSTTNRLLYDDLATADGLQPANMPTGIEPLDSDPYAMDPEYIVYTGNDGLVVSDFVEDRDAVTVCVLFDWDGNTLAEKVLAQHALVPGGVDGNAWKMSLTAAGLLEVRISDDGTVWDKVYRSVAAPDVGVKTLASFTWNGTTLRLYWNDVELTTGAGTMTKPTDGSIGTLLFDSPADVRIFDGHYGKGYAFKHGTGAAATPAEIASIAAGFGVSGLPAGGGPVDDFPTTTVGMAAWLTAKGATQIFYVDNGAAGNDTNTGLSTSVPWKTIQKASNTLAPGQAVIIRGTAGRFFESVTIGASGGAGNLIWYAGDPENPAFIDASEAFAPVWTAQTSSRWRAPYAKTRPYSASGGYAGTCTTGNCVDETVWMSHIITYEGQQLKKIPLATVPATLALGECYFEVGTGSYATPQYVWIRLPDDANPNTKTLRIGSNKTTMFDYSPEALWEGFPGGTGGVEVNGRSYIGVVNLHFRFMCNIRKIGMLNLRGTGWHVERSSFNDSNTIGLAVHGTGHYIFNCHFERNGQQGAFWSYANGVHMQRSNIITNNIHYYPPSWEAGGMKIVQSAKVSRCEISECLVEDNEGCGIWWDDEVGKDAPSEEGFFVHHCYFTGNKKGQVFFERRCQYLHLEDSVVFAGRMDDEGQSGNNIGPGLRFQAVNRSTLRRVVVVNNAGKGMLYKPDDAGFACNFDTWDRVSFIRNCTATGTISQGENEIQGGDDPNFAPSLWSTSVWTNVLVSNNILTIDGLFRRRAPGTTDTDLAATFATWTTASGTTVVADPATVVANHLDPRGCYSFFSLYAAWAPLSFIHPDDFITVWTNPA